MSPVLRALWGPEGAGPEGAGPGGAAAGGEQLVLVGAVTVASAVLLLSLLLMLCASCQGQKKASGPPANEDHQNLMNGVSEREAVSQSVESPGTELLASSSHNGPLTSGTVMTDTQDTSPHLSEEMLSSQSELRLSKCPQDRELPSIPPNSALMEGSADRPPASGDGTYEVVKEVASRDASVEDSLYETVKELKEAAAAPGGVPLALLPASSAPRPASLLNGHLSPSTPERGPLCAGVEYASVDLNKKSRYSADLEARRSASLAVAAGNAAGAVVPGEEEEEEEEEERPPPVPDKVLDENDNQPVVNGEVVQALHNGELHSPLSPSPDPDRQVMENDLYSSLDKPSSAEDDRENDYSSIAEIKGLVPASSSSDLYATVRDVYPQNEAPAPGEEPAPVGTDPGYEIIRIPKTGGGEEKEEEEWGRGGAESEQAEPDYESVGELGLNRETSRL